MRNPIRRKVAAAVLGLTVGLAGFGSVALAHRPPGCDNGQAVGNPHCDDDHDDDDDNGNGNGNGNGGHHHHGGSLINIGDIDLDLGDANIEDVTGVDLDAAIVTVVKDVAGGGILSDNNVNVLGCQINSEDNNGGQFNGEGNDGNNCGLLAGLDGDLLGGGGNDLLGDGVLAVLLAGEADVSITAGVLGIF